MLGAGLFSDLWADFGFRGRAEVKGAFLDFFRQIYQSFLKNLESKNRRNPSIRHTSSTFGTVPGASSKPILYMHRES